ncbi:MAG: ATP-binding protein [Candidatus Fimenecus sp.]
MRKKTEKRFVSIRVRLFLQIGAIFLLAVAMLLGLNRWYLPAVYAYNTRKNMQQVAEAIDQFDMTSAELASHLAALEKSNGLSIDLYTENGEALYHGKEQIMAGGGKVTMEDRREFEDGSYFETQIVERQNTQYIVYVRPMSFGGTVEMYSRKSTIDDNANAAIAVTTGTGVAALLLALFVVYFYSKRFTKPLIEMRNVTKKIAETDFSHKCTAETRDEIGELASSINQLSDSLEATLADLSEKNRKLQSDIEHEQRVDKMRKDFISNVSHELKTPISIVQGYAEGAKLLYADGNSEKAEEYCDIIVSEADKMNTLVLQLLELSQYESGSMQINWDTFDFSALAAEYVRANTLKFSEKGIAFQSNVPAPCLCFGDRVKMQMVLNNYLSNAVSHAAGEMKITLQAEQRGDFWRVTVFNTGEPIAEEDIGKIWDSFYRADKSHSRKEGRFGLGLSIVSEIQKLHKAAYGVENRENGVAFWFDILCAKQR